ncbi:MAG: ABC transporter permease [Acidobacteriota bacterium]|nr:ABC transporter permease [Acidobacteriota bacterium]MDE3043738.1 ABC transporter permease [Acidobacteriota bacterium]MDE3107444.1 ABC transporter permease [Acidobacteriota bacterium]MDE3222231.1 ABC transporter permease [Acidobacteriota bacterium]
MSSTESTTDEVPPKAGLAKELVKRLRAGDGGLLPILIGLVALVVVFQLKDNVFLSAGNLTNLFIQATIFILLAMAEMWVLLLGEIDLSVGYSAGLGGAVAVVLLDPQFHWPWFLAMALALVVTTLIGALWGFITIRLGLPSFIVTLAGLLGLEGALIYFLDHQGTGGSVSVQNREFYNLVNANLSPLFTWIFVIASVAVFSFFIFRKDQLRRSSGLDAVSLGVTVLKIVILALASVVVTLIFNTNRGTFTTLRGMPYAILVDFAMLAAGSFVLTRTRPGRYIYAIGGNSEAARRAGINVNRFRLLAFTLTGFTAGVAGLLYASRLGGVSSGIDGGNLVLLAVASAVIGGTSLFGGRGRMVYAVIGGLVIATIYNGMALLNLPAAEQYGATALVLLVAVALDSIARRGSAVGR